MANKEVFNEEVKEKEMSGVDSGAASTATVEAGEAKSVDCQEERLAEFQQKLEEAQNAKEEANNRMLRLQADFENFKRRSRQEYEQACLYGGEDLLKKILPVLDSLERAVAAFDTTHPESSSWQEGVRLTLRQFQNVLNAEGLQAVTALSQSFDPQVHEAVFQEESAEVSEPTVIEELQKGYLYKSKLLRPALVKVAVPAG